MKNKTTFSIIQTKEIEIQQHVSLERMVSQGKCQSEEWGWGGWGGGCGDFIFQKVSCLAGA